MKITLKDLALAINGEIVGEKYKDVKIDNILFDSRRLNSVNGTVFFAIKTQNNDGSKFIDELYNKGIRMFVCENDKFSYPDATILVCNDTVKALQTLAQLHRKDMKRTLVCAITGSNGKTITKEWIKELINAEKKVFTSPKSYNSQIGVPFSVCQTSLNEDIAIFEAGISKKDEMQNLALVIQPQIGIFTNIGDAHQIYFSDIYEKIDEKLKLFTNCQKLIFHSENPTLKEKIKNFAQQNNIQTISWGENEDDKYNYTTLKQELNLPFFDKASIENAINAFIFCLEIGINKENLIKRIPYLSPVEMRFEIKQGVNNSVLINDSYSNDLTSLEIALDYLNRQNRKEKLVILSDLEQSSNSQQSLYSEINTLLNNKNIQEIIAIGNNFFENKHLISIKKKQFYKTTDEYIANLKRSDVSNKAILLKGARNFHFELISRQIAEKGHQSVLEINLSAISDNVKYFRSLLKPQTKLMAMVKASAYGSGGYDVASFLERENLVDYLTVAFADEGVELRKKGIKLPIMVITPEEESMDKIKEYNLEPVIHSKNVLERFINEKINIHIKLDTGMHRMGLEEKDIETVVEKLLSHRNIRVISVFSHLYGADEKDFDVYTNQQIAKFETMSSKIINSFDYKIMRHICNSAGIYRFQNAHYDMVRLGIGMYGVGCDEKENSYLRSVHTLRTCITQIREISKGEDVSYSRGFVSEKPTRIGVIPIGYADGLNRRLCKGKFKVYLNGNFVPIIGNICMDMCMIDITDTNAKEGDTVIIFGEENPVENISNALQTIPYEVFTSISQRIKRVYYQE